MTCLAFTSTFVFVVGILSSTHAEGNIIESEGTLPKPPLEGANATGSFDQESQGHPTGQPLHPTILAANSSTGNVFNEEQSASGSTEAISLRPVTDKQDEDTTASSTVSTPVTPVVAMPNVTQPPEPVTTTTANSVRQESPIPTAFTQLNDDPLHSDNATVKTSTASYPQVPESDSEEGSESSTTAIPQRDDPSNKALIPHTAAAVSPWIFLIASYLLFSF